MSLPPWVSWQALGPLWRTPRPLWPAPRPLWQALNPLWQVFRPQQLDPGQRTKGQTDGRTDVRTDVQIPPVLQDFVPSGSLRSRYPKKQTFVNTVRDLGVNNV